MITLRQKLYESLLDDEDDIIGNYDTDISNAILKDLTHDIYKDYFINGIIKDPAEVTDDHIIEFFGGSRGLYIGDRNYSKRYKPIGEYLPGVDTIKYDNTIYIYTMGTVSKDTICENITSPDIHVTMRQYNKIENINFISPRTLNVTFSSIFDAPILNNVNFEAQEDNRRIFNVIHFYTDDLPKFKNVTVPKNTIMSLYNTFLGMDNNKPLDKAINDLLDPTYKMLVHDSKKGEDVERKTDLKKIQATVCNSKRYYLKTDLFHFKKGVKMSDFIPNLPKNIRQFRIKNNKMEASFVYIGNEQKTSELHCQYMDDGWRLEFYSV